MITANTTVVAAKDRITDWCWWKRQPTFCGLDLVPIVQPTYRRDEIQPVSRKTLANVKVFA